MPRILETKRVDFIDKVFELRLIEYKLTDPTHTKKSLVKKVVLKKIK